MSLFLNHGNCNYLLFHNQTYSQLQVEMDETCFGKKILRYFKYLPYICFKICFLSFWKEKNTSDSGVLWLQRSSIKAPTSFIQLPKGERNKYSKSDTGCLVFDNNP